MFYFVYQGTGSNFQSQTNPKPVVQVGASGSSGSVEITDMLFSTRGPTPGAIVVEWNVKGTSPASAGMWDSHIRIGSGTKASAFKYAPIANCFLFISAQGTNMGSAQCPAQGETSQANCIGAFLGLHLTPSSSAYIEGMWVWNGKPFFFRKQCYNKMLIFFFFKVTTTSMVTMVKCQSSAAVVFYLSRPDPLGCLVPVC